MPGAGVLPEKRIYGSDFPFRDVGQLDGITAIGDANPSVVSGAYGGFSNVWGAQAMPFSEATFDLWPVSLGEMRPHYAAAMDEMTLAADHDDLAELFPVGDGARPLPPPGARTERVLHRYRAQRALVRSHGITLGRARLAFRAEGCTRCGLCMTGCPYGLIYSSAHTFDRLRAERRIVYRPGLLAVHLDEVDGVPHAIVRHAGDGAAGTADRRPDLRRLRRHRYHAPRARLFGPSQPGRATPGVGAVRGPDDLEASGPRSAHASATSP